MCVRDLNVGPKHRDTAHAMHNLAICLSSLGAFAESEKILREVGGRDGQEGGRLGAHGVRIRDLLLQYFLCSLGVLLRAVRR